ncbi:hypothetical protein [Virgibacillus kimchii]
MENKTVKVEQIKKLIRKAEVTRNAYFLLGRRYKSLNNWLHFITLISASIVAILTFANFSTFLPIFPNITEEYFKLVIAGFASLVFLLTVTEEFLSLANKVVIHETPAKQLTTFIRTANAVKGSDRITDEDIEKLTSQYTMISESAPSIPDRVFIKAKRELLVKIEISKALDDNPFLSVKDYLRNKKNSEEKVIKETNKNTEFKGKQ